MIYNGEIYNYLELRKELAASGIRFRTVGDTEVLMQALIRWGQAALPRLNGMWAFVFLDLISGRVMLSRDRFGIKPLYTYAYENGLFIASEIKAILEATHRRFRVAADAANAFLHQNLLSTSESTFFAGVDEFPAGHYAVIPIDQISKTRISPHRYWSIPTQSSVPVNDKKLADSLRDTFIDSVRLRLRSDVPVGVLLSGGIDSSAIAAVLQYLNGSRHEVRLISAVGINGNDEQPFIDTMATHLNRKVDKVDLNYPVSKTFDLISEVSWFNDEPIGTFSTVAHYLLMNRARDIGVTVLLSGQGADEILCGYKKYLGFYMQDLLTSGKWMRAAQVLQSFLRSGTILRQVSYQEAKRYLPRWVRFSEIDIRKAPLLNASKWIHVGLNGGGLITRQIADLEKLSVPALVHYEDRMSMSAGREIRLPFLDYRLVNLIVPLPVECKLRHGWTKWIFRQAMEKLLPREITWRKDKQNFTVPQNQWFRNQLHGEINRFINSDWVSQHLGLIDRERFRTRYNLYLKQPTGGRFGIKDIFTPIALELWARRFERYLSPLD